MAEILNATIHHCRFGCALKLTLLFAVRLIFAIIYMIRSAWSGCKIKIERERKKNRNVLSWIILER